MGMSDDQSATGNGRLLDSGDEAGTAPGDRHYRPDVEGLRAVAILLVVLYHFGVPWLKGGFVGVDVFFVISGFVITGLLLRERKSTGHNSVLGFYARRCRRILPAASLVILVTVIATYVLVGPASGNGVAGDGRWSAAFLADFHFASPDSNPLSAVGNYWSLAVEEQFYLVFPAAFLLAARSQARFTLHRRLAIALGAVIVASYTLSVVQSTSHERLAYFSPFTRAWELALGALIAVGTAQLKQIPLRIAVPITWLGLGAIVYSALVFRSLADYPGWKVALPVLGAAMIIVGGVAVPRFGTESLLGLIPLQWLGKRSYSLYLWHWPVLILASEYLGTSLGLWFVKPALVLLAIVLSMGTYRLVENPIRHSRLSSRQSVTMGTALVAATLLILTLLILLNS
jgi:peptidoglycan/LPS O-acetylase OafA/YrhL